MTSVTLDQVAGVVGDFAYKAPCRVVAILPITLSGLQTVDGVALAALDRVLVTAQANTTLNGIYTASTSAWTLAPDFTSPMNVTRGSQVLVTDGTLNANSIWEVIAVNPVKPQDPSSPSSITFQPVNGSKPPRTITLPGSAALASTDSVVLINNGAASPVALTPPSPPGPNQVITIKDKAGNAQTYNITFTGTVDGEVNPTLIGVNYGFAALLFENGLVHRVG